MMRLRPVLAMGVLCLLGILAIFSVRVPVAPAQSDINAAQREVTAATTRLEELLDRLEAAQQRGNDLAGTYWQVESELELVDREIAASENEIAQLEDERVSVLDDVRAIAVNQYVSRGRALVFTNSGSLADREAKEALAELVVGTDQGAVDQLAALTDQHERASAALAERRDNYTLVLGDVISTRQGLEAELIDLETLRGALEAQLVDLETALETLEVAEARRIEAAEQAEVARLAEQQRERSEERERAEQASARAAAIARPPTPAPLPAQLVEPAVEQTEQVEDSTAVPNPRPSEPFATSEPAATVDEVEGDEPVPNPQPSEQFPTATSDPGQADASSVPNPQPAAQAGAMGSGGEIVCPLRGAFTHTDDFNAPRAVGGVHRANDLIANSGTPVLAVASGTIEHRDSSVGGMSAHLKGDNGDYYFYTHLNGYENVGAGQVSAGTVIGYVGMTGNAPIPHLHFEIHRNGYGNYTNPFGPVRAACGT